MRRVTRPTLRGHRRVEPYLVQVALQRFDPVFDAAEIVIGIHPGHESVEFGLRGPQPDQRGAGDEQVFRDAHGILQQAVRDDDVLAEEFLMVLDLHRAGNAEMRHHLQRNPDRTRAGAALADAAGLEALEVGMQRQIHGSGLLHQLPERRRRALAVEQHGIALELGDFHAQRIGVGQQLQQLLDDVLAVPDLGLGDEAGEAAEIRNEEQDFVTRCLHRPGRLRIARRRVYLRAMLRRQACRWCGRDAVFQCRGLVTSSP